MEPMPVVEPPLEPVKRKRDAFEAVSEEIKKCRITVSPGELRLQKDIAELGEMSDVQLSAADRPSAVVLRFNDHRLRVCPSVFIVVVGKFYPHQAPRIHCLEQGYASPLVNADGAVVHPFFGRDWMPLYTLGDVINVLQQLRMMYTGEVEDTTAELELQQQHIHHAVASAAQSPRQSGEHSPRQHVVETDENYFNEEENGGECQMDLPRVSSFTSASSLF